MRAWPFILGLTAIVLVPMARADDCNNAPDQTSMNRCMAQAYERADGELNRLYQQIIGRLKGDADMAKTRAALVATQRAWIAFRDLECDFVGTGTTGGTINSSIIASCRTDLTNKRIDDFKAYLKCEEGDLSCPVPPK